MLDEAMSKSESYMIMQSGIDTIRGVAAEIRSGIARGDDLVRLVETAANIQTITLDTHLALPISSWEPNTNDRIIQLMAALRECVVAARKVGSRPELPANFLDAARVYLEHFGPDTGHPLIHLHPVDDLDVAIARIDNEGGGHGYDQIRAIWRDSSGNIRERALYDTHDTKDWVQVQRADLCGDALEVDLHVSGSYSGNPHDKHLRIPLRELGAWNSRTLESQLRKAKSIFPDLDTDHLELILSYEALTEFSGGYSSQLITASDGVAIKQASLASTTNEMYVYGLKLDEFDAYRPTLEESVLLSSSGLLALSNIDRLVPAYAKSGFHQKDGTVSKNDFIRHNLYLMGLFHKEATKADAQQVISPLADFRFQSLDGVPHDAALLVPLPDSNIAYADFVGSLSVHNVAEISSVLADVGAQLAETSDSVIHGDWKLENLKNGYVMDFGATRRGSEIEDVAYFLVNPELGLAPQEQRSYLSEYISRRSIHDARFRADTKKHVTMNRFFDGARLKELTVYASVMRKRDLALPDNLRRRNRIANALKQHLREGSFSYS